MEKGLVSVVCVNWNGRDYIARTLRSVLDQRYRPIEVIVVDNKSDDDSVAIIREKFASVRLIENGKNAGWPAGLNLGIAASRGEYVVPINNDLWMEPGCVAEMVTAVEKDRRYGSCAAKVYLDKDKGVVEVAGVGIYVDGSSYARGRLRPRSEFEREEEVFCASDCCCLYKRQMLDEIGPYDDGFFLYAEETEMGWRYRLAGWTCIYTPKAVAYHEHSASSKGYSPMKAFHVERNRIWVAIRYFPPEMLLWHLPVFSVYRYLYQAFLACFGGRGALSKFRETHSMFYSMFLLVKVHLAAFRRLPYYLRLRYRTPRKVPWSEVRSLFRRFGCTTRELASYE